MKAKTPNDSFTVNREEITMDNREALISAIVEACKMMSVERLRMLYITAIRWCQGGNADGKRKTSH